MKGTQEETRKGPWTEQEDLQLGCFVGLFGDRRWDFIAKVSGLNRTGKSCRLRWVNYLHPGLKRGKITPQEEKLVIELHSKWGNRWSKIARKLPGRTDNEIKNYWRTYMRKKAQQRKRTLVPTSSSSSNTCSSATNNPKVDSLPSHEIGEESFYDTGGPALSTEAKSTTEEDINYIDDIWGEIDLSEDNTITPANDCYSEEGFGVFLLPLWEHSRSSPWEIEEEKECNVLQPFNSKLFFGYEQHGAHFCG